MKRIVVIFLMYFLVFNLSINGGRLSSIDIEENGNVVVKVNYDYSKDDIDKLTYKKLKKPDRIFIDFIDIDTNNIKNFIRKFENTQVIKGVKLWYHKELLGNKNVYRFVIEYDRDKVKNYNIVFLENKVVLTFYPKKNIKSEFFWSTNKNKTYNLVKANKKKEYNISLIDISYYNVGDYQDIVFEFNGDVPKYDILKNNDSEILLKFYSIKNSVASYSKIYQFKNSIYDIIEFLGEDNGNIMFKISLAPPNTINNVNMLSIERDKKLIITGQGKTEVNEYTYLNIKRIWNKLKEKLPSIKNISIVNEVKAQEIEDLTSIKEPKVEEKTGEQKKYIEIIKDSINIRKGPGINYDILAIGLKGEKYEVVGFKLGFYKIKYKDGRIGWVYMSLCKPLYESELTGPEYIVTGNRVNLRRIPSLKSKIIKRLNKNDIVYVLKEKGKWVKVKTEDNTIGWVYKKFIRNYKEAQLESIKLNKEAKLAKDTIGSIISSKKKKVKFVVYSNRDPFLPILKEDLKLEGGPEVDKLTLVGIIYDKYDKIALFELKKGPKSEGKTIFTMREGDKVKNGKLFKIYEDKVVFLITLFGVTKTYTLKLEKDDKR